MDPHTRFAPIFSNEIDRHSRSKLLTAFLSVAVLVTIPFLVIDLVQFDRTVFLFDVVVLGWLLSCLIMLLGLKKSDSAAVMMVVGGGILSLAMFFSGIIGPGADLWGVVFPFIAFALLGRVRGLVVSGVYTATILLGSSIGEIRSAIEILRLGTSLVCVIGISYLYEQSRERTLGRFREHADSLYHSEKKYRKLFEESNDGIFLHDLDGSILDANAAACGLVGYTRDTLLLMNVYELFAEPHTEMSWDAMEDTRKIGSKRFESSFKRADNRVVPVEVSSRVVDRERGTIQTIAHDIAQRKLSELREKEYSSYMRFLSESATKLLETTSTDDQVYGIIGEGLAQLVPQSPIVLCEIESATERFAVKSIHGIPGEELVKAQEILGFSPVGKTFKGPRDRSQLVSDRLLSFRQGLWSLSAEMLPEECVEKLRATFPYDSFFLMGLVHEGNLVGAVFILTHSDKHIENKEFVEAFIRQSSIALRRLTLEREVVAAREAAERANRTKGSFLANISHEVRTPMNAVIGMTNLALDLCTVPEQQIYLNEAKHAAFSLLSVLDDVLDFSRIESGRLHIDHTPFALRELLRHIESMMAPRSEEKPVTFSVKVDTTIPDSLVGDAIRIRQILLNLLSNAFKFTHQGHVALRVSLEGTPLDHPLMIVFEVSDTGIGIPQQHIASIFESFTQVDGSTTRSAGGAGLGLAICKELARLLNGDVTVSSVVGQGSVFKFRVPLGRSAAELTPQVTSSRPEIDNPTERLSGLSILVAEDTELNRFVVVKTLEKWGVRVTEAEDGAEAIQKLEENRIDLVLMDIQMPNVDGLEAVRRIRRGDKGDIPIIALTAHAREEDRKKCLETGMNDYIVKPISPEILRDVILRWVVSPQTVRGNSVG